MPQISVLQKFRHRFFPVTIFRSQVIFWSFRIFNLLILFLLTGWESFIRWEWPIPVFVLLLYFGWEIPVCLHVRFIHRLWIRLLAVSSLVICAMFVPPISLSPGTTFITSPLRSNGREPDYFIALKERLEPKYSLEDNGARDLLSELGEQGFRPYCTISPVIFHLHNEWSRDQESEFTDEYWQILCQEWQLPSDQNASCSWQDPYQANEDQNRVFSLKSIPWSASEAPGLARWLENNGSAIDLFKSTLEKPYWFFPMIRRDEKQPIYFLPNYGKTLMESLVIGLRLRITFSLGQEKYEESVSDFHSLIRLAYHLRNHADYWQYYWSCCQISEMRNVILATENLPQNHRNEVNLWFQQMNENNNGLGQSNALEPSASSDTKTTTIGLSLEDRLYCDRIYNLDIRRSILYGQWYDPWAEGEYPPYPCLQKVLIRFIWLLPWNRYFNNLNRYIDRYDEAILRDAEDISPELQKNKTYPVHEIFRKGLVNYLMDSISSDLNYHTIYSTPPKGKMN